MKRVDWFVLKHFDGTPIRMPAGQEANLKEVLLLQIGGAQLKDGKKAISAYVIGSRIYNMKPNEPLVLEDAEFELLKECVQLNPPQSAIVWGQLWQKITEAEETT